VAPTVENASVVVVVSAVADTWAVPGPGALVGLLTARRGLVSAVRVETVGAVVGSRGPVVGVATDLAAGSAGTVSNPRTGVSGVPVAVWGLSRVAEAARAARTPVVSQGPAALASKATATSSDAEDATSAGAVGVMLAETVGVASSDAGV
jgi:hypothetical protein